MQVLKGKDLERVNSLSVADAIRYFSGVQLKDYGGVGGLKTINVRSLGTNHTAVFYDGIELGNAQNGQVDLGKFSLDNIEELDLYDGQKNTIFQPAAGFAAGSSLYLISRLPTFEPGRSDNEKFTFRTGSSGLIDPSLLWQSKLANRIYSTVSAESINSNGRYKFRYTNGVYDTTAERNNGHINAQRFEAGLNGKGKDSSGWSAKFYLYNSSRGLPGAVVSNNFNYDQHLWDRNIFFQTSWHKDFQRYSLMANAKYSNNYSRYLDPDYVQTTGLLDNHYYEQEVYGSLAQRYKLTTYWDIALSSDYRWNTLNADLYHFAYPTRQTILNALATELHFPRLDIQGNLLNTVVVDKVRQFASPGNKTEWTPAVLASWSPFSSPDFRIRGFYKNIFRMPTFNDLYYTLVGNTFLRPEFAKQYDLGFTYNKNFRGLYLSHLSLQTDAYYNIVTDKIVAVPGANPFRWTMLNLGRVQIKGLEVNLQSVWDLTREFRITASVTYTYEQALDMTGGGDDYGQQIPYDPLNSGSALLSAQWRNFSLNYSYLYTGSRYDESANIPVNYVQPWYTHDLSFSYVQPVRQHSLKWTAEVNNLLNQYYDVITNYPMPGRNYRLTLQFKY